MTPLAHIDDVAIAYDRLAPYYDDFTAGYAHEAWIAAVEHRALDLGLTGRRALDIACGTGKSTTPLVDRGYSVLSCDISPGMVREAQRKSPARADAFLVADMRELPPLGEFDLVLCVDDALNYVLVEEELESAFAGVAGVLSDSGVFVFDLNSLATYRNAFSQAMVRECEDLYFIWRGEESATVGPGDLAAATVEVFVERGDGLWERRSSRHVQRHHAPALVHAALGRAGLECCAVLGQLPGAQFEDYGDEDRHSKLVYFARTATNRSDPRG
jgi:SAM-dependent methyltransferase